MIDNANGKMTQSDHWASKLGSGRINALCDGVFATAMTLLVLELSLPHLTSIAVVDTHFTPPAGLLGIVALVFMIDVTAYGRHVRALSGAGTVSQ